jgi:hypothetical protein
MKDSGIQRVFATTNGSCMQKQYNMVNFYRNHKAYTDVYMSRFVVVEGVGPGGVHDLFSYTPKHPYSIFVNCIFGILLSS